MQDLKVAVSAILRDLCQGCEVYPENFEKTNLNCSTSGLVAYSPQLSFTPTLMALL